MTMISSRAMLEEMRAEDKARPRGPDQPQARILTVRDWATVHAALSFFELWAWEKRHWPGAGSMMAEAARDVAAVKRRLE